MVALLKLDEEGRYLVIDRVLTARGFRYRPDPMGRLGEGDWIDDEKGMVLDERAKARIVAEVTGTQSRPSSDRDRVAGETANLTVRRRDEVPSLEDFLHAHGQQKEQINNITKSSLGQGLRNALARLADAAARDGDTPEANWTAELSRLGAEPAPPGIVQIADKDDPKVSAPSSRRWNFGNDAEVTARGLDQLWTWLNQDIKPLAGPKRATIEQIDETISALEAKRAKPGLSWFERWEIDTTLARLQAQRSKINAFFPSSPLDLAALGISAIGMVQVGTRAVPIFRQGNKVIRCRRTCGGHMAAGQAGREA